MISYKLNPKTGCEIYRDGQLVEIHPVKGHVKRLEQLGYQFPKVQAPKRNAANGYGWTKSAGIRRGC